MPDLELSTVFSSDDGGSFSTRRLEDFLLETAEESDADLNLEVRFAQEDNNRVASRHIHIFIAQTSTLSPGLARTAHQKKGYPIKRIPTLTVQQQSKYQIKLSECREKTAPQDIERHCPGFAYSKEHEGCPALPQSKRHSSHDASDGPGRYDIKPRLQPRKY